MFFHLDNKPKTYEIQDKAIDDERINIIRKLHERANNKICLPKHPVVEERYLQYTQCLIKIESMSIPYHFENMKKKQKD